MDLKANVNDMNVADTELKNEKKNRTGSLKMEMGIRQLRQIPREDMKEYGEFFKSMRKSIGYNLEQMAKEIGIFRTTLSKWEKGLIIPQQDIYLLEQKFRNVVKKIKSKQAVGE